jgi:hypothetical protein
VVHHRAPTRVEILAMKRAREQPCGKVRNSEGIYGVSPSNAESEAKKLCTVVGCKCTANLSWPCLRNRHMVLAHGDRVEVENRDGITADFSVGGVGGVVGAYDASGRTVLRCEGERDGQRCPNPTASTDVKARVWCEACAPVSRTRAPSAVPGV